MKHRIRKQFLRIYRTLRHPSQRRRSRAHAWIAERVKDRALWHPHPDALAKGLAMGLFVALQPIPLQMFVAVAIAVRYRWNVPLSAAACWITTPFTWAFTYGPALVVGVWMLQLFGVESLDHFTLSTFDTRNIWQNSPALLAALVIGCVIVGTALAAFGYGLIRLIYRGETPDPAPTPLAP